jgi:hypothetical protein
LWNCASALTLVVGVPQVGAGVAASGAEGRLGVGSSGARGAGFCASVEFGVERQRPSVDDLGKSNQNKLK